MPKMFIALNLAFVYNTENHNLSVFEFVHSIVSVVSSINHDPCTKGYNRNYIHVTRVAIASAIK